MNDVIPTDRKIECELMLERAIQRDHLSEIKCSFDVVKNGRDSFEPSGWVGIAFERADVHDHIRKLKPTTDYERSPAKVTRRDHADPLS